MEFRPPSTPDAPVDAPGILLGRAPTEAEWEKLQPVVAEVRRGAELVVPAPYWADPLARHAFGDALMPLRDVARPDESGYAHAHEIGILGERTPELAGWRESERRDVGRFRIRRLENPNPARVLFDFVESLAPDPSSNPLVLPAFARSPDRA